VAAVPKSWEASVSVDPPGDDEIEQLLADRACPWFDSLTPSFTGTVRMPGAKDVPTARPRMLHVGWFLAFARSRGYTSPALESLTDSYVHRMGGSRQPVHDPGRRVRNAIRRLRRRPILELEYVWALPPNAPRER
jgi:hypothetical protein